MPAHVPARFPSEREALLKHLRAEQSLSATQRLHAVVDALRAVEVLSNAGQIRQRQLEHQRGMEAEWQRRMQEFINQHVVSGCKP